MGNKIIAVTDSGKVITIDPSDLACPTEEDYEKLRKAEILNNLKHNIDSMSPSDIPQSLKDLGIDIENL